MAVANTSIQEDLALNDTQMGLVFAAFTSGYVLFQIPGGWLGQRFGVRAVWATLSVLWSLMTTWTASVRSFYPLLCSRFCFGLSQAGVVPIAAETIREWTPASRRGFSSAVFGASLSIGGVAAMGLTGWLLDYLHWRTVFYVYSVVGIGWSVLFYVIYRNKPAEHPLITSAELQLLRQDNSSESADQTSASDDSGNQRQSVRANARAIRDFLLAILRTPGMWALCAQSLFRAAGYTLFMSWFPAYLEYRFGIATSDAGQYSMYPPAAVIVGGLLGGILVDKIFQHTGSRWLSRSGFATATFVMCVLCLLVAPYAPSTHWFVVIMSAGAFFAGMGAPPAWAATIDVAGRDTGRIMGAVNMIGAFGDLLTTILMGAVFQYIRENGLSWDLVVWIDMTLYLLCATCWFFVTPDQTVEEFASNTATN